VRFRNNCCEQARWNDTGLTLGVAPANVITFPMMFLSGSFFPLEMMPGFLQTFARILPLYYVNEGLRASMVSVDNMTALRYSAVIGVIATVAFIAGVLTTKWEEGK